MVRCSRAKRVSNQNICPSIVQHYVWGELPEGGGQTLFKPSEVLCVACAAHYWLVAINGALCFAVSWPELAVVHVKYKQIIVLKVQLIPFMPVPLQTAWLSACRTDSAHVQVVPTCCSVSFACVLFCCSKI